jgi:hypothetical protein
MAPTPLSQIVGTLFRLAGFLNSLAAQLAARKNRLQTGAAKPTLRLRSLAAIDPALMSR